jgi:hypothetical protein
MECQHIPMCKLTILINLKSLYPMPMNHFVKCVIIFDCLYKVREGNTFL